MSPPTFAVRRLCVDPRHYQIAVLAALFLYGQFILDFGIPWSQVAFFLVAALATQALGTQWAALPRFDPRSPTISALSLILLLRTNELWIAGLASVLAVGSKFVLRWNGKHLFNPTNFGITAVVLLGGAAWVSPGQWGNVAFFGFLLACLGGLVLWRAERSDVTVAFLAAYAGLLFARSLWLGEPLAIPLHQLQSGALLIFAFFMISDPRTTPDRRAGRILFAVAVAVLALVFRFGFWWSNGLLWSLAALALTVPLLDHLLPGRRFAWKTASRSPTPAPFPPPPRPALSQVFPPAPRPGSGPPSGPIPAGAPSWGLAKEEE